METALGGNGGSIVVMLLLRVLRSTIGLAVLRFVWRRRARLIVAGRRAFASAVSAIGTVRAR